MLQALFQNTVSALCYELASEQSSGGDVAQGLEPPYNDIARFVMEQHGSMPQVLGAGVRLATILFALSGVSLFHRLEPARRRVRVAAWTASRLGPCRDLIRLYSSLVILALYSRPGVLSAPSRDREGAVVS
jgi:hypothetical protein